MIFFRSRQVKSLPIIAKPVLGVLTVCLALFAYPAFAQRADVPQFDKDGNFRSTRVQGNRGFYQQLYWLVLDNDPRGLYCRAYSLEGKPISRFPYGAVIKADIFNQNDNAILIRNGKTWLRVKVSVEGKSSSCLVRANASFIAPINSDDWNQRN